MEHPISSDDKAKEIFESMHSVLPPYAIFSARECSLICVNQIKAALKIRTGEDDADYWDDVLKKIKKF